MRCIEKLIDTIEYKRNYKRYKAVYKKLQKIPNDQKHAATYIHYSDTSYHLSCKLEAYMIKYYPYLFKDPA